MKVLNRVLAVVLLPLLPLFWVIWRLAADRCPYCRSKWRTEIVDEWGEEYWWCNACCRFWSLAPNNLKRVK